MSQPYSGEIRMFAGNFAPAGWMFCEGQLVPISENEALFNLIGTTYGGDGQSTFALPNLSGRLPLHQGTGSSGTTFVIGEMAGVETVTVTVSQIPGHTHAYAAISQNGTQVNAANNVTANMQNITPYLNGAPDGLMNAAAITPVGGSQPHENMQPYLCVNFIISLFGIFPSQN